MIFYILIATTIHIIFFFKREFLFDRKNNIRLLIASFILALISFLLKQSSIEVDDIELLQIPFFALLDFKILLFLYKEMYGSNPQDTFWSNDLKLLKDGFFNAIFIATGGIFPVLVVEWIN